MRIVLVCVLFFMIQSAEAGTCSATTRTNYVANSVLTSSALNLDFNQLVTKVNAMDAGCLTDNTLEAAALNTTDFAVLLNHIVEGCKVGYQDAGTLTVSKCAASVNGNFVNTTTQATLAFGCVGCTAEANTTEYYAYIKNGSTGTTLNLLISSTAPNDDGYDSSSNKALARFFNNTVGDIDQYSIDQWHVNKFIPSNSGWNTTTNAIYGLITNPTKDAPDNDYFSWRRNGSNMEIMFQYRQVSTGGSDGSGTYVLKLPNNILMDSTVTNYTTDANYAVACGSGFTQQPSTGASDRFGLVVPHSAGYIAVVQNDAGAVFWGSGSLGITNVFTAGECTVPILGWGD